MPGVSTEKMPKRGHATGMCGAGDTVRHQAQREESAKGKRQTANTSIVGNGGPGGHHDRHVQK